MSIPQLKKKLTRVFNEYVRLRDVDEYGNGNCISCGNPVKYGSPNIQAGHFYNAPIETLRYNENNVWVQCKSCNYFKSGNLIEYRKGLEKKIGEEGIKELDMLAGIYARGGYRHDRFTLEQKIKEYKDKVKVLKKTKMFEVK